MERDYNKLSGEQKFWIQTWAIVFVGTSLLGSVIAFGVLWGANLDHDFDRTCIVSGKTLTYVTIPGDNYSHKVCK